MTNADGPCVSSVDDTTMLPAQFCSTPVLSNTRTPVLSNTPAGAVPSYSARCSRNGAQVSLAAKPAFMYAPSLRPVPQISARPTLLTQPGVASPASPSRLTQQVRGVVQDAPASPHHYDCFGGRYLSGTSTEVAPVPTTVMPSTARDALGPCLDQRRKVDDFASPPSHSKKIGMDDASLWKERKRIQQSCEELNRQCQELDHYKSIMTANNAHGIQRIRKSRQPGMEYRESLEPCRFTQQQSQEALGTEVGSQNALAPPMSARASTEQSAFAYNGHAAAPLLSSSGSPRDPDQAVQSTEHYRPFACADAEHNGVRQASVSSDNRPATVDALEGGKLPQVESGIAATPPTMQRLPVPAASWMDTDSGTVPTPLQRLPAHEKAVSRGSTAVIGSTGGTPASSHRQPPQEKTSSKGSVAVGPNGGTPPVSHRSATQEKSSSKGFGIGAGSSEGTPGSSQRVPANDITYSKSSALGSGAAPATRTNAGAETGVEVGTAEVAMAERMSSSRGSRTQNESPAASPRNPVRRRTGGDDVAANSQRHVSQRPSAIPPDLDEEQLFELEQCLDTVRWSAMSVTHENLQDFKNMSKPPHIVKSVLETVTLLLGQPESRWDRLKKFVISDGFLQKLQKFNFRQSVSKDMFRKLRDQLEPPEFDEEFIKTVCVAAVPLAIWCRAIGVYLSMTKFHDGLEIRSVGGAGAASPPRQSMTRTSDAGLISDPDLQRLGPEELKHVQELAVSKPNIGSIIFHGETDCTNIDPARDIRLDVGEVLVYPDRAQKPPVGTGLNKPATVTMYQCWPPNGEKLLEDPKSQERYKKKIQQMTEAKNAKFIDYDCSTGVWKFYVDQF